MEDEKLKRRKVVLSNSIMPYFTGISGDLMFFIAINTLFLTVVKGLSAAQISFLTTISNVFCIILQVPALKLIQKIGNVKSIRIGTIMLLCSSILITFGNSYLVIIIGYMLYQPAFIFKKMDIVVLKSNLTYLNKQDSYIKIANKSNIIYAVITTIIAFMAGGIFAFNHYLPMYLCIGICVINILLSFCIVDSSENIEETEHNQKTSKMKFSKMLGTIFISFAILYPAINVGQTNSQLFIQYNLKEHFDIGLTATYLGIIIATSRVARILGNLLFRRIYTKLENKTNMLLSLMVIIAFACIWIGSYLDSCLLIKFIIMTIGFDIILAIRDPFELYINDLVLKNTKPEEHQKVVSYLQLSRRIVATILSLIFSILLIRIDLVYIIICLMILAIIALVINSKLYKMLN